MKFDILTIFPDFFRSPLSQGLVGKAIERGLLEVALHNTRDYALDRHRSTDDTPYGGGAGMVMKVDPIVRGIESIRDGGAEKVILVTPQGSPLDQGMVGEIADFEKALIVCGRYEGVDERVRAFVDMEVSVGDYILMGGEIPALVIVEAVARLIPGVLGCADSAVDESFSDGLLEFPHYTRPEAFRGMKVPPVLLSGDHGAIEEWRRGESRSRTLKRRPDLYEKAMKVQLEHKKAI
ncbi:MAG: tRNA (guanosine(37)-N1)-methyltransferase TrmD [Thermodesulfobacteriota bacterium]